MQKVALDEAAAANSAWRKPGCKRQMLVQADRPRKKQPGDSGTG
jgi:hypothetical protein